MTFFESIILGVVEGLTEFLPISSTGHLIFASSLLNLPFSEFLKTFEIVIQLGAILAVVVLYWRTLLVDWQAIKRIAVAFIPTAILGLLAYDYVKDVLLESPLIVARSLIVGGAMIIAFEFFHRGHHHKEEGVDKIPLWQCALIGVFQALAMIPGVSRSGATIIGGLALGVPRKTIVEFSFLLAVPTMLAASGLDLLKTSAEFAGREAGLLAVGFIIAFATAILAIKFFLSFIQRHSFSYFGWYRIAAGLVFILFFL